MEQVTKKDYGLPPRKRLSWRNTANNALTRFLEDLNGASANNKHPAEGLLRVAQNLSFMKK